ncbi:hypothetical protein NPT00_002087 [Listeria monocytogenes]|uniref:Uncharacterized protein n=2 Tax=Listeria monocytogenes TaxID=1639 RepID=A0AAN2Z381_LISMN|nr:hypothetical protein [Listeria monocytogenes]EAF4506102.1 hypothetical protein [Listeria monocytogenes serotype 1/2a]EAC2634113.1 hypothetical protein [Listeria monocytogenes]EAC4331676.1 hypothetical protein [Listeria monocytogenes]EAC6062877.1 hypothetical protein [Listeria monocytogenes]EAC8997484.1 hypothetical protein [Listeria monocytogenes]
MLLGKAKIAEVVVSNVEVPKVAVIQSVNKSPRYSESGEAIRGSVAKISCQFVDVELAKLIQKSGADSSELKTYPLELIGNEQDLLGISADELIGSEVKLQDAKVMLQWQQGRNGGGWRGLKLVLNVSEATNESEKK